MLLLLQWVQRFVQQPSVEHQWRRWWSHFTVISNMVLTCSTKYTRLPIFWVREMKTARIFLEANIHTHTRLTALFPGIPRWAGTRKVKRIWILLKQETVSGSGISWATCKSAPRSRQITTPAPHCSVFYRPGALPAAQPTASKHWRRIPWSKTE